MRGVLLSCLLFLGIGANAQIYTFNGFQSPSAGTGDQRGWVYSTRAFMPMSERIKHQNLGNYFICNNLHDNIVYGGRIGMENGYFDAIYTPTDTGNGEAITCSVTFKGQNGDVGNIGFRYSLDRGTTWIALGSKQNFREECQTMTGEIPAGVVTAANSSQFRFMVRVTATNAASDPYLFIDDIKLIQKALVTPNCPNLTTPVNNARNVSVRPAFSWDWAIGAQGYKLSIGTTSGDTDILNQVNVSNGYIPDVKYVFPSNTKHYVRLVGTNPIGDSDGCAETTFTTGDNPFAPYCGPTLSTTPTLIAPITSVDIARTTYTSDATATTLGAFEPHQSFADKVFTIKNNVTTVPITVKAIGAAQQGWAMTVFIDWNNDGNFDGAGEAYFTKNASILRSTTIGLGNIVTLTGNLPIPTGTTFGRKRLRIKYSNSNTVINDRLTSACSDLSNGQVEDYTISYEKYLAVSDVDKKNISVHPNPFKDILKISEVKNIKSLTVVDASGKVVATPEVSQELNLSNLSKGVYFITVSYHNRPTKSFKVIKE